MTLRNDPLSTLSSYVWGSSRFHVDLDALLDVVSAPRLINWSMFERHVAAYTSVIDDEP